jgi:hypothetical protein
MGSNQSTDISMELFTDFADPAQMYNPRITLITRKID